MPPWLVRRLGPPWYSGGTCPPENARRPRWIVQRKDAPQFFRPRSPSSGPVPSDPLAAARRHPITDWAGVGTAESVSGRFRHLAGHRHGPFRRRLDTQGLAPLASDPRPPRADRLGVPPLRQLLFEAARPMSSHQTIGASHRNWRTMGLDGTTLDVPDTRAFGTPTTDRADGAFPQVRLLALFELGTHAVCGLAIKPLCHGEQSMVAPLLDQLGPGTLLIWDRGFFSYKLISAVVHRGAHLL